ncbi:MAG: adenylate kinase [Candidatus Methanoperedens sp.]|nr:adenylate kinase [Candidatus Methanoperedens sp.]
MIIALTGTPGTGKTTVCGIIKENSQYRGLYSIIDLNKIIIEEGLHSGRDEESDSYIADFEKLEKRVKELTSNPDRNIIIEGHLSHFLPADSIIVLRAHPVALRKRLGRRKDYSFKKIKENANAEALDVILVESSERSDKVFEIDTTNINALAVVKSVIFITESLEKGKIPEGFLPGKLNWIDLVEL